MGETWVYRNEGLAPGMDRLIHSLFRHGPYLYAGTHPDNIFRRPVADLITGIPDQKEKIKALVYPNPLTDQSKIIIPSSFGDKYTVEIYNEVGQLVKKISGLDCDQFELNRNDFCRGIYFLRLIGSKNTVSAGKFIVN
jgi:hypothetical protein